MGRALSSRLPWGLLCHGLAAYGFDNQLKPVEIDGFIFCFDICVGYVMIGISHLLMIAWWYYLFIGNGRKGN